MLRLVPAGGIACVCLLVVQQKQMSTRVNIPLARRGNVVVSLLRLGVQLRVIFVTVACCWLLSESSGFLAVLIVAQYKMPPRRRGRSRGLFQESGGQNEDQYSAPSHTLESSGEEEAAAPSAPVERMDMPPRRRGRSRGLFQESGGQNEDQYSAPSHTLESSGEEEAAAPPAPVVCRVPAIFVVSTGILLECVRQLDHSRSWPSLRVVEVSLGVVLLSFSSPGWVTFSLGRFSSLALRILGSRLSLSFQDPAQRFAFTLKIQLMACAMIKPAGSHSYLESAGTSLKDNQQRSKT
ncbi:hypothetical protein F511_03973 [Dorcoceras hygrometricum]|uniref:Uncharacterized protein n=1 Tax=Dorcoceras hygrometricum TaxID=472368 RepID=A0A2Z7B7M7_9LAMI|nr:hypothetical protein F511_03973 [Dorcoceras hygrometricum]